MHTVPYLAVYGALLAAHFGQFGLESDVFVLECLQLLLLSTAAVTQVVHLVAQTGVHTAIPCGAAVGDTHDSMTRELRYILFCHQNRM